MRPNCECCGTRLPPDSNEACICTIECTFCRDCTENKLHGVCPNCGGELVRRPVRPARLLGRFPASTRRIVKAGGCVESS